MHPAAFRLFAVGVALHFTAFRPFAVDLLTTDMSTHRDDHGRKVPIWNGTPESFEHYKDEIRIWVLSTPANMDFSMAARLVSHGAS